MLNLDPRAQQLLSFVQQQATKIDRSTEQKIAAACEHSSAPLSGEKLQKILCDAMPQHAKTIQQIGKKTLSFQCDNTNAAFMTQIVGLHDIEKERAVVFQQPHIARVARDPLSAKLIMAKNADVMLLFNASQFDDAGRPLLLKIVAREKMKDKLPDLSNYHTLTKEPDVQLVANDAAYVTIKDEHEAEFQFGSALAQVSLDAKGNELSRSGAVAPTNKQITRFFYGMNANGVVVPNPASPAPVAPQVASGPQLDTTPVQTYRDRIQLSIGAKEDFPKGGWLETQLAHVDAEIAVEPGYMLEPSSHATIQFASASVTTEVKADDFSFIGSGSADAKVPTEQLGGWTMSDLLNQNVIERTKTGDGYDQREVATPAYQLIYSNAEHIKIGTAALDPLGDRSLTKAELAEAGIKVNLEPMKGDKDGTEVLLSLDKGFLSAAKPGSVDGWKVVVGFHTGANGETEWTEAKPRAVKGESSAKESFRLQLPNAPEAIALNRSVEIRIFNDRGVPAQRVLIPFTEIPWGPAEACETPAQS